LDEKVPLLLTAAERTLLIERVTMLPQESEDAIRAAPEGEPVLLTLDELDDLIGFVAAEANHTQDTKLEKALDRVFAKIEKVMDKYVEADESPPSAKPR
jgi:hypothetical protein